MRGRWHADGVGGVGIRWLRCHGVAGGPARCLVAGYGVGTACVTCRRHRDPRRYRRRGHVGCAGRRALAASLGLGAQCGCWCGMHRGGIAWLLVHAVILAAAVLRRAIWRGLRPACARAQRIHSIALAECAYYLDARHDGRRCHGRSYDARLDHCERCRLEVGIPLHRPCATCAGHRVGECHEAVARRTDPHPARHIRHAGIWRA